jgi:hypothetical protein
MKGRLWSWRQAFERAWDVAAELREPAAHAAAAIKIDASSP